MNASEHEPILQSTAYGGIGFRTLSPPEPVEGGGQEADAEAGGASPGAAGRRGPRPERRRNFRLPGHIRHPCLVLWPETPGKEARHDARLDYLAVAPQLVQAMLNLEKAHWLIPGS